MIARPCATQINVIAQIGGLAPILQVLAYTFAIVSSTIVVYRWVNNDTRDTPTALAAITRYILSSVALALGLLAGLTGLTLLAATVQAHGWQPLLANAASVVILLVAVLVWIIALVKLIRTFATALDRSDEDMNDPVDKAS